MARKIIMHISLLLKLIKIFLHNKIHFKINSIIYKGIHVSGEYRGDYKVIIEQ